MNKRIFGFFILALASTAFLQAQSKPPLALVPALDAERYMGRWFEIARYPQYFENGLVGTTAEYALRKDGKIDVVNSGLKKTLDGKYTSVKAIAYVPDPAKPAALKVRFFNLFPADYLVFALDAEEYQWALVGNNSRKFLWFLSRTPTVPDELLEKMKAMAEEQGYDLSKLYLVPQRERDDAGR